MLRGWGVSLESDGRLTKLAGKQGYYDAHAVLDIGDAQCFQIAVKYSSETGRPSLAVGLTLPTLTKVAAEAPSFSQISRESPGNCTVQIGSGGNIYPNCSDLSMKLGVMQSSLSMQYLDGNVTFTFDSQLTHSVTVPVGNYRPFIFLGSNVGGTVHISVSRKRKASGCELNARLWRERKFADAVVICRGHRMPVHRAVLAAASPVFERMWQGSMREAAEAKLEMDDAAPEVVEARASTTGGGASEEDARGRRELRADGGEAKLEMKDAEPEVVEAMLQYMYTSTLPSGLDRPAPLFHIAKKYGVDELAEEMGVIMLEGLAADNVEERVRAIRLHAGAGDASAQQLWDKLFAELRNNQELLRTLLEQLTQ